MTGLTSSYAANLMALNHEQQDARASTPVTSRATRIRSSKKRSRRPRRSRRSSTRTLEKATKGVKGTFGLLSAAAGQFGESDLATSIDEYATILTKMLDATRDFADAAVSIAKAIKGLDDVSADKILLGAGLGFNFAMIAVAIQISGVFGKSKPPTQVILEQLREVRKQIVDLRDEMRVRFDRIEKRLNKMYLGLLNRLAEMDFDLGQIEGNVDELQLALYDLHSELQRLNRSVHAFLEAAHRRELVEAINGFLRFRERTGEDLGLQELPDRREPVLQLGQRPREGRAAGRSGGPQLRRRRASFGEITSLPLATNVNYLRRFPAERFNLAALSALRLANPFDWIVAGEAYAQLCEESPARTVIAGPRAGAHRGRRVTWLEPGARSPTRRSSARSASTTCASFKALEAAIASVRTRVPDRPGHAAAGHRPLGRRRPGAGRRIRSTRTSMSCGAATAAASTRRTTPSPSRPASAGLRLLRAAAVHDREQPQRLADPGRGRPGSQR